MKKIVKLLLLALTLALFVGTIFAVSAMAEDNSLETPYGTIPSNYTDVSAYPVVIFNDSKTLVNDSWAGTWRTRVSSWHWSHGADYGYIRQDLTITESWNDNFGLVRGTHTLDLGNHTLTAGGTLFTNELRTGAGAGESTNIHWTFKNGTINLNGKSLMKLASRSNQKQAVTATYVFENITFEGFGSQWLIQEADLNGEWTAEVKIIFKNCTFNATHGNGFYTATHDNAKNFKVEIEFIGGQMNNASSLAKVCTFINDAKATGVKNVKFSKNDAGDYLRLNFAKGTDFVSETPYQTTTGETLYFANIGESTDGKYTVYTLKSTPVVDLNAIETPYGVIPGDYKDSSVYPIVIFTSSQTVQGYTASNPSKGWAGDWASRFSNWSWSGGPLYGYLREDITVSNSWEHNFGRIRGTHTLDLGGNTVTAGTTLFTNEFRLNTDRVNRNDVNFTFKNGTINLNGKSLMKVASYNATGTLQGTYIFENITFDGVGSQWLIVENDLGGNWNAEVKFIFKDCTFNIKGGNGIYLTQHANAERVKVDIEFQGGQINDYVSTSDQTFKTFINDTLNTGKKNVYFSEGSDGELTCINTHLVFDSASDIDKKGYVTSQGTRYFVPEKGANNYSVYRLGRKVTIEGKDYFIQPCYDVDPQANPILVFWMDENWEYAYTYKSVFSGTDGAIAELAKGQRRAMYLMCDITDKTAGSYFGNFGTCQGTLHIDLGGHTVNMQTNLFNLQAKNVNALNITVANGTMKVNNVAVVRTGVTSGTGKTTNFTFKNINFTNITGSGAIVNDLIAGNTKTTTNVHFIDCDFYCVAKTNALFKFGVAEDGTATDALVINIRVQGGEIVYDGNIAPISSNTNAQDTNKSVILTADVKITAPTGADISNANFVCENGATALRKTGEADGYANYVLSNYGFISTYLNITSDLNMVYRVFLPSGATPAVTFTYGDYSKTIEEYTVDQNGLFLFKLSGITAARIGKEITATLAVNGEVVSTNTYSIVSYLDALKKQNEDDKDLIALVDALLVYGAAAQAYVGDTDAPVANIGSLAAIPETATTLSGNGFAQFGMSLDGAFALRVGIALENTEGVTLEVNKGGKITTYNLVDYTAKNGIIAITYGGILANELDSEITFTLKNADATIGTLTVSANSYLYRANALTDENLATLARAIYAYGVMANAYAK